MHKCQIYNRQNASNKLNKLKIRQWQILQTIKSQFPATLTIWSYYAFNQTTSAAQAGSAPVHSVQAQLLATCLCWTEWRGLPSVSLSLLTWLLAGPFSVSPSRLSPAVTPLCFIVRSFQIATTLTQWNWNQNCDWKTKNTFQHVKDLQLGISLICDSGWHHRLQGN